MRYILFILLLVLVLLVPKQTYSQVYMRVSGANLNLNNAHLKLGGNINISSGSFTQKNSSTISLDGNWTNAGVYTTNNGMATFYGANSQTINKNTTETYYDMFVSKSSGTIILPSSRTVTISNDLTLNSTTITPIFSRDNGLIRVAGNITRPNLGHIDGPLSMYYTSGNTANATFTVGNGDDYTPVEIDLNGSGGTAGYVQVSSNERVLTMLGSQLDADMNVEREYEVEIPNGSSFVLGASQSYTMNIHYLNPNDIRNGANSNTFETARYDATIWASELMNTGIRTNSSIQSTQNQSFGTFVVGPEDFFIELFSRKSGSFTDASNWSLYGYGSSNQSPFAPRSRDIVRIGDNDSIALDQNHNILSSRTLFVETAGPTSMPGKLMTFDFILNGSGTFTLESGGILGIGNSAGIVNAPTLSGSVQTADRNYNNGNHNLGSYVYTSATSGTIGNGLPSNFANLTVQSGSDILMTKSVNISNDLSIISGNLDADSYTLQGTASGTFTLLDNAQFTIGDINNMLLAAPIFATYNIGANSIVEFDGGIQILSDVPANFNSALGFGFVDASNSGTKYVQSNLLVRGDLNINTGAYLEVTSGRTLDVEGSIKNNNSGLMQFGNVNIGN